MSDSIEKNRARTDKTRADEQARVDKGNSDFNKLKSEAEKNQIAGNKRMFELSQKKHDITSDKWKGTEESRVDEVNKINGEMRETWKSYNDMITNGSGVDPLDITKYDTADVGTVTVGDEKYVIPQDLAASIIDSNGEMKVVGNEVHQKVYEQNSVGQPIPKKDNEGNDVFEHSGVNLPKYSDVFKSGTASDKKRTTVADFAETDRKVLKRLGYKDGDSVMNSVATKVISEVKKGKEISLPNGSVVFSDSEGIPLRDANGKMMYKTRSKEAKGMIEKAASVKSILNTLDNGYEVVKNDPTTVGSIGNNPADWIGNVLNDIAKVPTDTRLQREALIQFTEPLAATMRSINETGVMTDRDLVRYLNMLPQLDDSPKSYKSKYETLRKDIKDKYMNLEEGMSEGTDEATNSEKLQEKVDTVELTPSEQIDSVMKSKGYDRAKAKRFIEWKTKRGK